MHFLDFEFVIDRSRLRFLDFGWRGAGPSSLQCPGVVGVMSANTSAEQLYFARKSGDRYENWHRRSVTIAQNRQNFCFYVFEIHSGL